jgi:hypothetical protein
MPPCNDKASLGTAPVNGHEWWCACTHLPLDTFQKRPDVVWDCWEWVVVVVVVVVVAGEVR